jgi:hypothetical protein
VNIENTYNIDVYKNEKKIDSFNIMVNNKNWNLSFTISEDYFYYMDGSSLIRLALGDVLNTRN